MTTWSNTFPFPAPKTRLTVNRLNEGKRAANEVHDSYFARSSFQGLRLRAKQNDTTGIVHLLAAEQIIMNDGACTTGWQNLTASMAGGGLNGLDTGVPSTNKWYEIYAVQKSSDNTKGLLLHRAREYNRDEAQDVDDTFVEVNGGATPATRVKVAQGFQTDLTGVCNFVEVKLQKVGTWTGLITLTIEGDSAGNPSGVALATSELLNSSYIAGTATYYRFYFRNPATLTAGTQYHLVASVSAAGTGTDYLSWRATSTVPYTRGTTKLYNGTTWSASALDQTFHVYVTVESSVVLPSGYDRYCRIGFAFYNSSNYFNPFWQMDRHVQIPQIGQGTGTNAFATLADWSGFIPPITVMGRFAVSNSVAGTYVAMAPSNEPLNSISVGAIIAVPSLANTALPGPLIEIYTEGQANYVFCQSGTYQVFSTGYRW